MPSPGRSLFLIISLLLLTHAAPAAEAGPLVDPLPSDDAGELGATNEGKGETRPAMGGPLVPPGPPREDIYVQPPTPVTPGLFIGTGRLVLPATADFITSEPGETRFKFGAFFEHQTGYSFHPDGSGGTWSGYEEIRLKGTAHISNVAKVGLEWQGRNLRGLDRKMIFDPRAEPPGNLLGYDEFTHDIMRGYLQLNLGRLQFYGGRQNIDWGQGWMFNPTNIFQRKNIMDPDDDLVGTDALRTTSYAGRDSELDVVIGLEGGKSAIAGANYRWGKYDGSLLYGFTVAHDNFRKLTVAGGELALKSHLAGTAFFIETAAFFDRGDQFDPKNYGAVDVGVEKILPDNWHVLLEYYHDGHGFTDSSTYGDTEYYHVILGERQVIGRNYVVAMLEKKVATSSFRVYTITNTYDSSTIIAPEYRWEPLPGASLVFGATVLGGPPDSEFRPQGFRNIYDAFDRCTIYARARADF